MKLVRLKLVALELKLAALVLLVALGVKPTALARELKSTPPLAQCYWNQGCYWR